jgi:hypothetical protein
MARRAQIADQVPLEGAMGSETPDSDTRATQRPGVADIDWLELARQNYQASDSYYKTHLQPQVDRNLRLFQGRHEQNSKYYSVEFNRRSKNFRPKTRSFIRRAEAAYAAALFSTSEVVAIEAEDDNDPQQLASAQILHALMTHHLTKTIPWYMISIAAFQSAQQQGVVVSKQYWDYKEEPSGEPDEFEPKLDEYGEEMFEDGEDDQGQPVQVQMGEYRQATRVVCDKPVIELIPFENVRIAAGADWLDPIHSAPYCIILRPMYLTDIEARMDTPDPKTGVPPWFKLDRGQILQAARNEYDSTRQERDGKRTTDRFGRQTAEAEMYNIIWVQEHFARVYGVEYTWWTLADVALLTDPKPLTEVYHRYDRPLTMGIGTIEAFRPFPASKIEIAQDLQRLANEISNQRIDNVRLSMNPRLLVRLGAAVDLEQLTRSVPNGIIEIKVPDVTNAAYMEQDRVNADYDSLLGTFDGGSVSTNRQMNETVGGMQLMAGGANALVEYDLRTFVETWVEPVCRDVMKLIQRYETDARVLAKAGKKAQLWMRYGVNEITDELLSQELSLTVAVGIGANDPMQQLQKLGGAFTMLAQFLTAPPHVQAIFDLEQIIPEIFGKAGYKDGMRFFKLGDQDPNTAMLQQRLEAASKEIETLKSGDALRLQIAQLNQQATVSRETIQAQAALQEQQIENKGDLDVELLKQQGQRALEQMRGQNQLQGRVIDHRARAQEGEANRGVQLTKVMADDAAGRRDVQARAHEGRNQRFAQERQGQQRNQMQARVAQGRDQTQERINQQRVRQQAQAAQQRNEVAAMAAAQRAQSAQQPQRTRPTNGTAR